MRIFTALLCGLAILGSVFLTPVIANDDNREALAIELVEITVGDAMVDRIVGAIWPTLKSQIVASNENINDEMFESMKADYAQLIRDLIDVLIGDVVGFYATEYTEDELKELLAFYGSLVGQKTLELMPKFSEEIMPPIMIEAQREFPNLTQKFKEMAKEQGVLLN